MSKKIITKVSNNKIENKTSQTNKFCVLNIDSDDENDKIVVLKESPKEQPTEPSKEQLKELKKIEKQAPVQFVQIIQEVPIVKRESKFDLLEENWESQKTKYMSKKTFSSEIQQKELYIEKHDDIDYGNSMFLNSPWTVWIHKSGCKDDDWTESSYTNLFKIDNIGSFWRFFNNFHLFDKIKNQLFIMRNKIKPIWEDNENRKGGIYSLKFDYSSARGKVDIGTEIMICISLLVMNETLISNNNEINGISYSIKNKCVLIKIWCKHFNSNVSEKIPLGLLNRIEHILSTHNKSSFGRRNDVVLSKRYVPIKPMDEVE